MAKCQLTGKRRLVGNNVSHAKNRTKKNQFPNIQKKRIYVPEHDQWVTVRLSTRALRTITRQGLARFCKKNNIDLKKLLSR